MANSAGIVGSGYCRFLRADLCVRLACEDKSARMPREHPVNCLSIKTFSLFFRKTAIHATALTQAPERPNCDLIERSLLTRRMTKAVLRSFLDNQTKVLLYEKSRPEIRRTACLRQKRTRRLSRNR